jgi:hypothetical protein
MDSREYAGGVTLAGASRSDVERRRIAWHALAVIGAAVIAWLVFAAYRQPDLILDFAVMRLC